MSKARSNSRGGSLIRQGWISLTLWIAVGLLIEAFIGYRIPALLDDSIRRDLFRLAHAHGTLLSVVLLAAGICVRLDLIRPGRMGFFGLRAAALLLPFGFLLGGVWHFKDDPGLGIVLVPVGALALLATALHFAWSAPR